MNKEKIDNKMQRRCCEKNEEMLIDKRKKKKTNLSLGLQYIF